MIGVSLGERFTPAFMHNRAALAGFGGAGQPVHGAGFAWLMARLTGPHLATLVLGSAPGDIAEMAIMAKVLQLGVPMITAFQICWLVAALMLAEPVFRWRKRRWHA